MKEQDMIKQELGESCLEKQSPSVETPNKETPNSGNPNEESNFITSSEEYHELILQYREKGYEYLAQINDCLAHKSIESMIRMIQIYQEEEMLLYCVTSLAELAYAHIFAAITADEINEYGTPLFVLNGSSVQELIKVLKQVEFRMWEVEFDGSKEAEQKLYTVMKRYRVTPEAMKSIIMVAGMDKKTFYGTLACIYLEHQEWEDAIRLLKYAVESYAEEKELIQLLVQLCEKTGKAELAAVYRGRL